MIIETTKSNTQKKAPKGRHDYRNHKIQHTKKAPKGRHDKHTMPGTFSQIYIQTVFAVKGRENLLQKPWREEVFRYMSSIIKAKNQKPIIVNGVADHVHLFIGLKPAMSLSDLVRDVKSSTSNFINEKKFVQGKFSWQEGFGAFSYAHSQIDNVYQYVLNQEEHHRKRTFREEYLDFLNKFDIEYDEKYLFEWLNDSH